MKNPSHLICRFLVVSTAMLLIMIQQLPAQLPQSPPPNRRAFGIFGAMRLNSHSADFRSLPAVPSCCPQYTEGDGTGYAFGLLYEIPLSDFLYLSIRGDYAAHGAELTTLEAQPIDINGQLYTAQIEHGINAGLTSIGLQPMLGYRVFPQLSLLFGGRLGIVSGSTYEQTETLVEPANMGTFENRLRTGNTGSGDIPDASSLYPTLAFGVRYSLPLSLEGALELAPEVMYHYGIGPVVSELDWYAHGLQGGVVLRYTPPPPAMETAPPPPPPPAPEPPPAPPVPPALAADITAVSVGPDGGESPVIRIVVEEVVSTNLRPMLPYIFFAEGSSTIDARYDLLASGDSPSFDVDALHEAGTLEVYYDMLNIIGARMQKNRAAQITVTGCNDGTTEERGNTALSHERASAVKTYLTAVWGIDPARIRTQPRDLPPVPSRTDDPDGQAENRRVEITSTDPVILAPIRTRGVERQVTPPSVRFIPRVTSDAGIRNWSLTLQNDRDVLLRKDGNGEPQIIEWQVRDVLDEISSRTGGLSYQLTVHDGAGQNSGSQEKIIPLEIITIQKKKEDASLTNTEIARYSLILFDYDKAELSRANLAIATMIREEISPASTVTITGYTDRIGEASYNRDLSLQRAQVAARAIRAENAIVDGKGESVLHYDNSLPEGRFFSRTVDVIVETPVSR